MKKIFLSIALMLSSFFAHAAFSYIRVSGPVLLESGSIVSYDSPDIYCTSNYDNFRGVWVVTLQVGTTGSTSDFKATIQIEFPNATIDAISPSGSTNTEKTKNMILQVVVNYLTVFNDPGTSYNIL